MTREPLIPAKKRTRLLAVVALLALSRLIPILLRPIHRPVAEWMTHQPDLVYDWLAPWSSLLFTGLGLIGVGWLAKAWGMTPGSWFGRRSWKDFLLGGGVGFLMICVTVLILLGLGLGTIDHVGQLTWYGLFMSMHWVLIQSSVEEVECRGLQLGLLQEVFPSWGANLIQAAWFSAAHLINFWDQRVALGGPYWIFGCSTFGFGVLFGLWKYRSGSIWGPSAAHFMWNWTMGTFFQIQVSGTNAIAPGPFRTSFGNRGSWLTGGAFIGLEGGLVACLILGITTWGIARNWRSDSRQPASGS